MRSHPGTYLSYEYPYYEHQSHYHHQINPDWIQGPNWLSLEAAKIGRRQQQLRLSSHLPGAFDSPSPLIVYWRYHYTLYHYLGLFLLLIGLFAIVCLWFVFGHLWVKIRCSFALQQLVAHFVWQGYILCVNKCLHKHQILSPVAKQTECSFEQCYTTFCNCNCFDINNTKHLTELYIKKSILINGKFLSVKWVLPVCWCARISTN